MASPPTTITWTSTTHPTTVTTTNEYPCPEYLKKDLNMQIAEVFFGFVGMVGCLSVLLILYAFNKDKRSLSDRIVIGLFVANFLFSVANIVQPISTMHRAAGSGSECWAEVYKLPSRTLNSSLSFWVGAKFAIVCYEIFLVGASLVALQSGSINIQKRWEVLSHMACFTVAIAVMVTIGVHNDVIHANHPDDYGRQSRDMLSVVMVFWTSLLAIVFVLWICQRVYLGTLMHTWKHSLKNARLQWDREFWNLDAYNKAMRERRERLLEQQKESYIELTLPLQGYIIVFLLFTPVTIVLDTSYCEERSVADGRPVDCDDACMMFLSLRTIVTVGVYFVSKQHRLELWSFRHLRSKAWSRFVASIYELHMNLLVCCGTSRTAADSKRQKTIGTSYAKVRFRRSQNLEEVRYFDKDRPISVGRDSVGSEDFEPLVRNAHDPLPDPTESINFDAIVTPSSRSSTVSGSSSILFGVHDNRSPSPPLVQSPPLSPPVATTFDGIDAMLSASDTSLRSADYHLLRDEEEDEEL
eukprot:m.260845 g.260845  ORF g.260845 m.260845 type:complete len:525 (+) comp40763_c0_seq1:322-1896(+)